ncbi:hypothetical protein AOCH_004180 [Aspergillus ochraceoroseus]|uniref:G domain-containing protein n=1 Tax=Aspergillus ochraceoroseus TaxID=138278 RepID=A0A0F8UMU8_9EURO|nr:hypothetical protein AOCH_004180 [Aspergillus ochraceoroseus]
MTRVPVISGASSPSPPPADNITSRPHTPEVRHIVPSTEFTFSPSGPGFNFAFTPPSREIMTPGSDTTNTRFGPLLVPSVSRESTTSDTRARLSAVDRGSSLRQENNGAPETPRPTVQRSNLSPNLNIATYRDLHNATPTPSPQPTSSSGPSQESLSSRLESVALGFRNLAVRSQESTVITRSPLSSHLESVALGFRNLAIRNEEVPSIQGHEEEQGDNTSDSWSDASSGEESDEYHVSQEKLPDAPIYNVRLQRAVKEVRSQLLHLSNTMGRCGLAHDQTTDISALYEQVQMMSKFDYPATRTVGLIGDSGVGKSSLVNALLDQSGLSRSSGNGTACTSVVTEFRNVDERHQRPYTVEADFMGTDEIRELLRELVRCFRRVHTEARSEIVGGNEWDLAQSSSVRAWAALEALFSSEPGFSEEFLSNEEPDAENIILTQLKEWIQDVLSHKPGGPDAIQYSFTAQDAHECKDSLDMLTMGPYHPGGRAIWPFVKMIRVFLKSPILRTGLVIADLPGLRDSNYVRVRATERYLRHSCEEVFIVCKITRCDSDVSIQEIIDKCTPDQQIRIVCTQSETVDAEETMRDRAAPRGTIEQIQQLLANIRTLERSLRKMEKSQSRNAVGTELWRLAKREAKRLKKLLIETRNRDANQKLSKKYNRVVKVFCVSSQLYTKHRADGRQQASEYIDLSGILELRQYCQLVPAQAQFQATSAFLENSVPALLKSLDQWILAGSNRVTVERAQTLRRALDEARATITSGAQDELLHNWESLLQLLRQQQSTTETRVTGIFESVCDTLEEHVHLAPEAMENLLDSIDAHQRCINVSISSCFDDIIASSTRISWDASDGHSDISYMADIMRPAYDICNLESGRGSHDRRKRNMDQHLRHSQIFLKLATRIQVEYDSMTNTLFDDLKQRLEAEVQNITRDLGVAIAVEGEVTEASRVPALADEMREKIARIEECLDEAQTLVKESSQRRSQQRGGLEIDTGEFSTPGTARGEGLMYYS